MRTAEYRARDAERARFRYHNNAESRARKKEKMRIWAINHPQKTSDLTPEQKERRRLWNKSPNRLKQKAAAQKRYRDKMKSLGAYKNYRGNRAVQNRRWQSKPENQIKRLAHLQVFSAVKAGTLKRQLCEICGKKAVAHHDDYSKPLDVRWLCNLHHYQHHQGVIK